jgi:DNA-binding transcriptional MerR regulator
LENMPNLYLIKDLARFTGLSVDTVKYYLKIGLITESGRSPETNFRYFDDSTVEKLNKIIGLRRQKHSISKIRETLNIQGQHR